MAADEDWLSVLPEFSQIAGNLWMGGCPQGLGPAQFHHFVALYEESLVPYSLRAYQTLTVARMTDSEIIPGRRLLENLVAIINILRALGPTLVHCRAGLNRSGLVLALVLIGDGVTPREAIARLRAQRHADVLGNEWFERWLLNDAVQVL